LLGGRAPLEPRRATLGVVRASTPADAGAASDPLDQVIATYFPGPSSYTGEDVVELSAHGSPVVLERLLAAAVSRGARLAEPGEFTLRAYLAGRMDLMQAEAVADLIESVTPLQARAAFDQLTGTLTRTIAAVEHTLFELIARLEASVDFPEEGYHFVDAAAMVAAIDSILGDLGRLLTEGQRGRLIREGLQVAIVGRPNVGKSSLFNALVGADRAIVAAVPGTTRDLVTEVVGIGGLRFTLVDTAGLRSTKDEVEAEGVERSRGAAAVSAVTLVVLDGSAPLTADDEVILRQVIAKKTVVVANKSDVSQAWVRPGTLSVSAKTRAGLEALRHRLLEALGVSAEGDVPAVTNIRHLTLIERAREAVERARAAATIEARPMPEEFLLADLQDARAALEEITGKRTSEDILSHIFARFCIGK
jgi:tRNA modification GTPase